MNNLKKAHNYCTSNKDLLEKATEAYCFSCLKNFHPYEIIEYVDEGKTAICPYCGIDSVLPNNTDIKITEEFLKNMKEYYFG